MTYPPDWPAIALNKKQSVNWTCENCGRVCYPSWYGDLLGATKSERKQHELSVHHQDYNPGNNSPSNLIALCSACHLKKHLRRRGNITPGQLTLTLNL